MTETRSFLFAYKLFIFINIDDFYIDRQINYISHRSTPLDDNDVLMSAVCKAYDPPYVTSKVVYQDIKDNIEKLIEEAIEIRNRYPK